MRCLAVALLLSVYVVASAIVAPSKLRQKSVGKQGPLKLKVLVLVKAPFVVKEPNGQYSGLVISLLEAVAKIVGFTYDIVEQTDLVYGTMQIDGQFDGAVRQLADKKVDMIAADVIVTSARDTVIGYSAPYLNGRLTTLQNANISQDAKDVVYLVERGSVYEGFLRDAIEGRLQEIWTNVQADDGFVGDLNEGVKKVLSDSKYQFLQDDVLLYAVVAQHGSELQIGEENLKLNFFALCAQLGSTLRNQISVAVSQINEDGRLLVWIRKAGLAR